MKLNGDEPLTRGYEPKISQKKKCNPNLRYNFLYRPNVQTRTYATEKSPVNGNLILHSSFCLTFSLLDRRQNCQIANIQNSLRLFADLFSHNKLFLDNK